MTHDKNENIFAQMLRTMDELEKTAIECGAPAELVRDLPALVAVYWDKAERREPTVQ